MSIFNRKKREKDDEYDDEEYEEFEERAPSPRKFKDLNPENKKKRKEPVRPWGRRERLMVLIVLLATIFTSGILSISARNYKLPGLPRFSLPSFNWGEGTIIIEGNKEGREKAEKATNLFKDKTKNLSGVYALYVIRLSEGRGYGVNENELMQAASFIKLPVLATLFLEAEKGSIDLETKYTLKNSDKRTGSGSLSTKPAGTVLTYRDLARLMGKESDNTTFNIIRNVLGDGAINEIMKSIGMLHTSLEENETTPYDIGLFFEKLWQGEIVPRQARDEILDYLTDTIYEEWIVKGIPDVRVAHKYGRESRAVNDAGIILTEKPFVLVIMSDGAVETEADKIIPEIAKKVYEIEIGK